MSGAGTRSRAQATPGGLVRAGRNLTWEMRRWAYIDRGGGLEDTVFLAGSGRSGTTWIEEVINRNRQYRVLFEPFWTKQLRELARFGDYRYVPPGRPEAAFGSIIEPVLAGRVRNRWIDHHNTVRIARRRLVKEIRANNWIGWAADRWPQLTVLFVVRHPMAVVSSGGSLGWGDGLERVLSQPELMRDHFDDDTGRYLRSLTDPWERSIARWCTENIVPFRTLGPGRATLLVYEALAAHDDAEIGRLLDAVGQERDAGLHAALGRPSRLARPADRESAARPSGSHWLDRVDPVMRKRGVEVIARLGFGEVFGDSPEPDVAAAHRLWGRAGGFEGP